MNAIATTPTGTAALTARVSCEAAIGWRTELIDGFPKERIEVCSQVVGLRSFIGVDNRRHAHCGMANHEVNVRRRFPEAPYVGPTRVYRVEGCATCDGIATNAGGFGPAHEPSPKCESGSYTHCSCDVCF